MKVRKNRARVVRWLGFIFMGGVGLMGLEKNGG